MFKKISFAIDNWLKNLFNPGRKENIEFLSSVEEGDKIMVYHENAMRRIVQCTCLYNDIENQKMTFKVRWYDSENKISYTSFYVRYYDGDSLREALMYNRPGVRNDFLKKENNAKFKSTDSKDSMKDKNPNFSPRSKLDIQKEIDNALDNKDFQKVAELQKELDKIDKKQKPK